MYDEEKGIPIMRNGIDYDKRRGPVMCEASIGCPKGHWRDNPDLNESQLAVIDLFEASRASGGRLLTDSEAGDWFLTMCFAKLQAALTRFESNQRQRLENALIVATAAGR